MEMFSLKNKMTNVMMLLVVMLFIALDTSAQTTVVNTTNLASDIKGFHGNVPVDIYIKNGKVQKVVALKNNETPSFFQKAAKLLTAWNGKTVKEASTMKVDAVTGATYSSNAIIYNVRRGLNSVQKGKTTTAKNITAKKSNNKTKTTASTPAKQKVLKECKLEEMLGAIDPFHYFNRPGGVVLCAGNREKSNAMAISGGDFGTWWGQSVARAYVAEARYTHQFMESSEYFTIMSFDDQNVLTVMGTKSGRDMDKAKECGLTTLYTENGTPYYAEATTVIECKIIFSQPVDLSRFKDEDVKNYSTEPTTAYTGKIVRVMKK